VAAFDLDFCGGLLVFAGASEAFGVCFGEGFMESDVDETLRRFFGVRILYEGLIVLAEEARYVRDDERVRLCWFVARMMHRRQTGSLDGARGRLQPLEKAAIVFFYISIN
jgi:hypothetical protein